MIVDRRKDNYDELLVLARDARVSRARTNRWTTGLIVATMAAGGAYVAATNSQVDELRQAKETADAEAFRLNIDLSRLLGQHEALRAERNVYKQNAQWFAEISPSLNAANRLGDIAKALGSSSTEPVQPVAAGADFALSNLVWYVDGSRRFPMAANDILWIPEGQFWVRLEEPTTGPLSTEVTVHFGAKPSVSETDPDEQPSDADDQPSGPLGPFRLVGDGYYEQTVLRGIANCVKLELDSRTERPVFGTGYVDMVVTYYNNPSCADGYVEP